MSIFDFCASLDKLGTSESIFITRSEAMPSDRFPVPLIPDGHILPTMKHSPPPPARPSARQQYSLLLGMLLLILATGFVLLPTFLARRFESILSDATGGSAQVRNVVFWGGIGVERIEILVPGDSTPSVRFDSVVLMPDWSTLLDDTPVIRDIVIDQATFHRGASDTTLLRSIRGRAWIVERLLINRWRLVLADRTCTGCRATARLSPAGISELRADTPFADALSPSISYHR